MKTLTAGLFASAVLATGAAWAEGELRIYSWADYTSPKLLEQFSHTYDVGVSVDDYTSDQEMLATVRVGNSGYDVVVPNGWAVQLLIEEGLLTETKPREMGNFKNIDPRWIDVPWDPGRNYSVPNLRGTVSLAIDTATYGGVADSLSLMFDPPRELQGRIGVLFDSWSVMQAALRYLGKPQCNNDPKDLAALNQLLTDAKRHWRWIESDLSAAMAAGNISLAYYWNNPVSYIRQEQIPTLRYIYPREGFSGWMDNVAVLKDAPNIENAKLFQNFMMDPKVAALNSEHGGAANAIPASGKFLPAGFAEMPEIKLPAGAEPEFVPLCPKEVREKYGAIWAEVTK